MTQESSLPRWYDIALREMGVQEMPGPNHNKRILEYHATSTLAAKHDEVPWCSAFVNWCMTQAGLKGTNLANARSWLTWGHQIETPVVGCLVVLTRGNDPAKGHVAFFHSFDNEDVILLGGNQNNKVGYKAYKRADILSFRWPFKVSAS